MKILGITTTHAACGCALADGETLLAEVTFPGYRTCTEELAARIEELFESAGVSPESLGGAAVDAGPGGLTGLKVGLVTAKTFSQVLNIPLVGVPSFEILAADAPPGFSRVLAVIHSSRDEFFTALHERDGGGKLMKVTAEKLDHARILAAAKKTAEKTYVTGGGVEKLDTAAFPAAVFTLAPPERSFPRAATLCRIAGPLLRAGKGKPFDQVQPEYLCPARADPDAAEKTRRNEALPRRDPAGG
ncbi:MAG: tRNA (adenosine(37)-N6)-threonylcarbamoyltransferase complex dimerization subunit type 1 TsaB [bacterium]